MRVPTWILWAFVMVSCIAGFGIAISIEPLIDSTATASGGGSRVWVETPFTGPGEAFWLAVEANGPLDAVTIDVNGETVIERRTPKHGKNIRLAPVMPDRYGPIEVLVRTEWRAERGKYDFQIFNRRDGREDVVRFVVRSRSGPSRWAWRLGALLLALAFWVQAIVGLAKALQYVEVFDRSGDQHLAEAAGGAACVLIVVYAMAGYWVFVLPVFAATHWVGTFPAVLWMLVWLAGAPYLGWRLRSWLDRPVAHRIHGVRPTDLDALRERLSDVGVRSMRVGGWLRLAGDDLTIWVSAADLRRGGTVRVLRSGERLALRLCLALERPVVLETHGFQVDVEGPATLEGLEAELLDRRMKQADEMLKILDGMKGLFDRFETGD